MKFVINIFSVTFPDAWPHFSVPPFVCYGQNDNEIVYFDFTSSYPQWEQNNAPLFGPQYVIPPIATARKHMLDDRRDGWLFWKMKSGAQCVSVDMDTVIGDVMTNNRPVQSQSESYICIDLPSPLVWFFFSCSNFPTFLLSSATRLLPVRGKKEIRAVYQIALPALTLISFAFNRNINIKRLSLDMSTTQVWVSGSFCINLCNTWARSNRASTLFTNVS